MRTKFFFLFVGLILILSACGSKPEIFRVDPAYAKYVAAYPSGMMSRESGIRIELTDETLKKGMDGDTTILKDIFSFEPEIQGHAEWVSERVIEFVPDEKLPANQFYTVSFDLEKVATVQDGHDEFRFQFATYTQKIYTEVLGLDNYDDYDIEWQYLRGKIATTDVEDTTLLKQTLHVEYDGKELPIRLEEGYEENEYFFYADSIERKDEDKKLIVSWDGSPINSFSRGQLEVDVIALGNFTLSQAKVHDREDQTVEMYFTEPINAEQDLTGLITLTGIDNPTFSVEGNRVTLFLPKRTVGTKKLEVNAGIQNVKGHKMREGVERYLTFEEPKPRVKIRGEGSILPNSQGLIFPFESIGLKSVEVRVLKIFEKNVHYFLQVNDLDGSDELTRFGKVIAKKTIDLNKDKKVDPKQWSHHVLDLGALINPEPGAIYRVSIKFTRKDAVCDCPLNPASTTTESEGENEEGEMGDDWNERLWNSYGFDDGFDEYYDYYDEYSACSDSYYYGKAVSRNILASDLGMVFKLDEDKTTHAFVNDMLTTDPVKNATIEYYSYSRDLIASGTTNDEGMLEMKLKEKPFLMVAKRGNQRGYLKLRDGNVNSLSKFDVEGETSHNGIKGFIYGERGVWRPGDSLYLAFMLGDKFKKLPDNHPVKFQLQDPMGQVVYEVTRSKNVDGIYDFRTKTEATAVTGNYLAVAQVGNQRFYKTLKVETIKPNRLKIDFRLDENQSADSAAYLSARWLHGAIARSLRSTITVSFQPSKTVFKGYKDYVFDSPLRTFKSDNETVFDGSLNEKGVVYPKVKSQIVKSAPGKLKASYVVKVFEESGDFSIDRFQTIYSPYKTYIGLKAPSMKVYDQTLNTDEMHKFDVTAVNESGKAVDVSEVQVKIYKLKWRWWYERDEEDLVSYVSRSGTIAVKDTVLSVVDGKGSFRFRVRGQDYGRYLITVTDKNGQHQTGQIISFDWPYWSRGNRTENEQAKMLSFSCDKETYTKGEKIKLSFPSPESGRALVSVENGRKVLQKFWIKTKKGETTHELTATAEMAPAAYIHVTMIQPHSRTANDLPIRMYGVIPVNVDDPQTHLEPVIQMADVIKPESKATINVKESSGRRMVYTLAVVDEGLLDLTRFQTPQPWNTFYAREALGVKTWDMYDDVIGAYAGRLDNLISIGGDGSEDDGTGPKANRFKPMIRYIGPFVLEAGKTRGHTIDVPNYIGSVRVMVVAHNNEGAYGNAEKAVAVRKPLMLLTTLPRVVGPGEEVSVPVTVFAMENHVRKVNVGIDGNNLFEVVGENARSISFTENGDQIVFFKVKVKKQAGIGVINVKATSGNESAHEEIELDVRPANPEVSDVDMYTLEKGAGKNNDLKFFGMAGTNRVAVELSSVPSIGLEKRLKYLISYPHGCVEQTTSAAFPQLYVGSMVDLTNDQKKAVAENVEVAIKKLQSFQTSSGGFSYWPGEGNENEWATNYAGHFLIEAEEAGYKVPSHVLSQWNDYQMNKAKNWVPGAYFGRQSAGDLVQAYRLFLLALNKSPEIGAMNRLREKADLPIAAKWRLAAAYKLAGQSETAKKLIAKLPVTVEVYRELSGTFGSDLRDQAMILEALSILGESAKADALAKDLAEEMRSERWMSTQETAYGLIAICTYTGKKGAGSSVSYSYQIEGGEAKVINATKVVSRLYFKASEFKGKNGLKIVNKGTSKLFVSVITSGIPEEGSKEAKANGISLKVRYVDSKGNPISPDKILQGTEFEAEVVVKNLNTKANYREIALTHVFPSGWEIHNVRMDESGFESMARYQDFRDDRVLSYVDLTPNELKVIRVKLNASYLGKFYLPGVYAEAMYDRKISAYVPGKWVEVSK